MIAMSTARAFVAVLVLALSACTAATDTTSSSGACAPGEVDGDLRLYTWAEYEVPELFDEFAQLYGVDVITNFYPSNEDLLARMLVGGGQYDVIVPSDYMVSIMIEEDLLLPLDRAALTGLENVADDFAAPEYDPQLTYTVPFQWGTTGLGINVELLGDVTPSWRLLLDPDVVSALPGRVAMLDDAREVMAAALHLLGRDPNTTDENDLADAAEIVAAAQPWVASHTSQYADLLVAGEVVVAQGYNGTFLAAFGDDPRFAYVVPEEGATVWTDNLAIPADAANPCTAHAFVSFMLDGERAARLSTVTGYASPNAAATPFMPADMLNNPAVYPPDDVRERLRFLVDTGDFEIVYSDAYERAKR
jgi:spermidine/putrescine transport system substrate-binding protein